MTPRPAALAGLLMAALVALAGDGAQTPATPPAGPWIPDLGGGRYQNPVIFADYSDPDVVRAGDAFYLVASSFNVTPALPILRSPDLDTTSRSTATASGHRACECTTTASGSTSATRTSASS